MLGGIISLASYGLNTGGTVGNILYQLEQQGVFSYVLPFLMIFAITYGILDKTGIFKQNNINIILSLAVSLMALQMNFVSYFFRELFPRMGVVLSIILVIVILLGLFFDLDEPWVKTGIGFFMIIGLFIIVFQSLDIFNWIGFSWGTSSGLYYWFQRNGIALITGIF